MDIYRVIDIDEREMLSLDPVEYPSLTRLWKRSGVMNHLYSLMEHMKTYSSPLPILNNQYFLFSEQHLAEWNLAHGGSGSVNAWQSHKVFLLHTGLIKTCVVIGNQKDPILQGVWDKAVSSNRRSETLWTVPLYTTEVLEHAERIAREYLENHVNLSHITKKVIVRVWDQATADSLFRNSKHTISKEDRNVENLLKAAMKTAVDEKGFTTLDEVASKCLDLCLTGDDSKQVEYEDIIKKLFEQKRLLIERAGYYYHRIRKKDRDLALPEGCKVYIITER